LLGRLNNWSDDIYCESSIVIAPLKPLGAAFFEALGGKLEIRAVFPDREVRITQFEELT
jgi:hypothetical protein